MSTTFYKSIVEDEINVFSIKKESLKAAAVSVAQTYSRKALTKGTTFLDYNLPSNRCAYLYKYASIHSGLVTKYFRKLIRKKIIKSTIRKKETIKVCCLGGGPGTDIVGLFRALALIPHFHQKVVEVTVLDICGGWRNSFKRVISSVLSGKIKDIPETFVNISNFKFKLIEVNLLDKLPTNVTTVISNADIVCMVKFVSAILGSPSSVIALKVIAEMLKIGAIVLFIDNYQGNVFKPIADISEQVGLQIVLGPLHESFNNKTGYIKGPVSSAEKEVFGCLPLYNTRVTVLGFIKSNVVCNSNFNDNINYNVSKSIAIDNDYSVDDSSDANGMAGSKGTFKSYVDMPKTLHNQFTQTDKYVEQECTVKSSVTYVQTNELNSLVDSLCDLVNVFNLWLEQKTIKRNCDHC